MRALKILGLCILVILASTGIAAGEDEPLPPDEEAGNLTIYDTLLNNGTFTLMVTALNQTGLNETLSTGAAYTFFAPTDEAINAYSGDILNLLLRQPDMLKILLNYHIADGTYSAADLEEMDTLQTLLGMYVAITVTEEGIRVNEALITQSDITCTNGVVHVIDAALEPPGTPKYTIYQTLNRTGNFATLVTALDVTGLNETLNGTEVYTVFAPTDGAFNNLPEGTLDALLNDTAALNEILLYHVVDGFTTRNGLVDAGKMWTLQGKTLIITETDEGVMVNDARITIADLLCRNGLIHVIDAVLVPPEEKVVDVVAEPTQGELPLTVQFAVNGTVENITSWYWDFGNGFMSTRESPLFTYHEAGVYTVSLTVTDETDRTYTAVKPDFIVVEEAAPEEMSIFQTAAADESLSTLVTALEMTGLDETLNGTEIFTLFAPTDEAFAALPEGALDALLDDTEALNDILLHHAAGGEYWAADLIGLEALEMLSGKSVRILWDEANETLMIDDALVTVSDVGCTNGVIHVIDGVLQLPEEVPEETPEETPEEEV
ncbi:fasciclin domain-containing protein [Methanofollis tationis]|uniref:Fasciclin domain-containing protein n=1 Tax=Methanofollis tationis TaxID=81417 RepID=A0A7K4HLQ5_9EURY|nr:fasciclin domain-containing protein [Methanofollis tationis]NVO66205.1 fasciclin domain-containing protein [Methanofollis tationis]